MILKQPTSGIFGLAGTQISKEEKSFFSRVNPLGFILFARNCETPDQVKQLTKALRELLQREDVLILIDQEGGRVVRLKPPHWRKAPPAGAFAAIADSSIAAAKAAVYANARLIARELHDAGINVDCAPLADVPVPGAHDIIGDRAYGDDPHQVSILAARMASGLLDGGVLPVLKHIPGHGRAKADSHEALPVVSEPIDVLQKSDFIPFKALSHLPLGMTAHILYTAMDAKLPATLSKTVIDFIRNDIGFDGLLMSDDISMKALSGSLEKLTQKSLAAGCDIVLHCNGKREEMEAVAKALLPLADKAERRFERALAKLNKPADYDFALAEKIAGGDQG
jgi:beta-N-acetylhexosaminidase